MSNENKVVEETVESDKKVNEPASETKEKSKALTPKHQKIKKHHEAKKLVDEAKSIVESSESELQLCRLVLEDDLKEYNTAKKELKVSGYNATKDLLLELGHNVEVPNDDEEDAAFEAKEDTKPMILKDVRSGRFTGVLLSLFGGLATFSGLIYWATEKLGITLDLTKVPTNETMQSIFGWFGNQIGRPNDALNGALSLSGLAVQYSPRLFLVVLPRPVELVG